jgi:hypothetical protein
MAFPASLTLVTVQIQLDALPNGGGPGTLQFVSPRTRPLQGTSLVPPIDETVAIGINGSGTIDLPAVDASGWAPQGWAYTVLGRTATGSFRGTLQLFAADDTVDLHERIQIDGAATAGTTYATLAQLTTGLAGKADTGHTHTASQVTDFAAAADIRIRLASPRIVDAGEYVLDRGQITASSPLESGTLFLTHFTAAATETITTLRTGTGGSGTVATSSTHAWIGILNWDGTNYTPAASSVDDPTRWTAEFATYDTPLQSSWAKTAGQRYALFLLWIGSGQPPSLAAGGGWYQDSLIEPRSNALLFSQTAPPNGSLSGAFFGPDSRRFQALMKR